MSAVQRYALFGHPVGHSVSPALHAAGFRALGLAHTYEAIDLPDLGALARACQELREGAWQGANVTVPWKRAALSLADETEALASEVGAANLLTVEGGRLVAGNTDVDGLADDLRAHGAPAGRAVLILGHGGAALAAAAAARALGCGVVRATARAFQAGVPPEAWPAAPELARLGATPLAWSAPVPEPERLGLVLQATSAGMRGGADGGAVAARVPWAALGPDTLAYDLVYNPPLTPFLVAARAAGLRGQHGLGMLVRQASAAERRWVGAAPPFEVLWRAAAAALGIEP